MYSLSSCLQTIQEEIEKSGLEKEKPVELYEPVEYILNLGGKRIRPALVLMGCNLFDDRITDAIPSALAIEIFHNFTLVHDDIMDNAPIRRNKPTVHEKWGQNVAILSGDAMQILAYQKLCTSRTELLPRLLPVFNVTALKICEGQQFDMNFATRMDVRLEEYIRMIELKTSVLLAASLKMGAICGEAPQQETEKLYQFGRNLGIAFQIQDDYLDTYASQEIFGKTIGGDISENKKTFLLIKAMELASGTLAARLGDALNNKIPDINKKIAEVKTVYNSLDIPKITLAKISEYADIAFGYLDAVEVDEERKKILRETAIDLMKRNK